jgi:Domain of unknown function (DUF4157)
MSRTHSREQKTASARESQHANQPVRGEDVANQITSMPGTELPTSVRQNMESRFDADFSNVRVHSDRHAAEAANALDARAFTIGQHIAFERDQYAPTTTEGQRLLAHELAHVMQQRGASGSRASFKRDAGDEREADRAADRAIRGLAAQAGRRSQSGLRIQADDERGDKGGADDAQKAAAQKPAGARVTFVLRAPDDAYTRDVTDYAQNTLKEKVVEVDNLQEAVEYLNNYARTNKTKVGEVRIIGHGGSTGGIRMTPKGETGRRFVSAEELEKMAADDKIKAQAAEAMAEGSTVEFWGCYVGGRETSTRAVAQIFNSDVKAIDSTLRTTHDSFRRQADHGEKGEDIPGQKGKWITAISTQEIDFRVKEGNKKLGESFNKWLIAQSKKLEANGDVPPQPDDASRITAMRDLFDRSGGKIKQLQISSGGTNIGRSDKKKWLSKWKTTTKK